MTRLAESRSSLRALALSLTLAVGLAGCGEKVPRLAPVGQNDVIVAFGDSLTHGTGAAETESYPAILAQLINRNVIRAGVPGEMTAGGVARLAGVIDEHRPALVLTEAHDVGRERRVHEEA